MLVQTEFGKDLFQPKLRLDVHWFDCLTPKMGILQKSIPFYLGRTCFRQKLNCTLQDLFCADPLVPNVLQ